MTFFTQTRQSNTLPMRALRVRWFGTLALLTYPVGCIVRLFSDGDVFWSLLGLGIMCLAGIFTFVTMTSGVNRIVAEGTSRLDPLEHDMRRRAFAAAYRWHALLLMFSTFYLQVATDSIGGWDLWMPTTGDHWNGVFFGTILFTFLMPNLCLAWTLPARTDDDLVGSVS